MRMELLQELTTDERTDVLWRERYWIGKHATAVKEMPILTDEEREIQNTGK